MTIRVAPNSQASPVVEPAQRQQLNMNVQIDNHYHSKIYTTSSTVSGRLEVKAIHDVQFDNVEILLLGVSKTRNDAISIPQATSHTFLKLIMPVPESCYPETRRFKAGSTYTIPFHFVIPQQLTLSACSHRAPNDVLKEEHLRLPPSMGGWGKDDFSPTMSRVTYSVRARVYQDGSEGKSEKMMEALQDFKMIPTVSEDAPLDVTPQDKLYAMSKSKTLRKSILSPKLGKVTVVAQQPAPAMISSDGHSVTPTTAHLNVEFEPESNDSQPPKVISVTSKIAALTYYSACGINQFPNTKDWVRAINSDGRGAYSGSAQLPTTSIKSAPWEQHLTSQGRRDSGYESAGLLSDSEHSANGRHSPPPKREGRKSTKRNAPYYYTTKVQIPVEFQGTKKQFIPTFHSCITSRVYVLWMAVTLAGSGGLSSTINVGVPLQIGVSPEQDSRVDSTGLPTFEAAMEDASLGEGMEDYFQPRTIAIPNIEFRSELPGYAEFVRGSHAVRV
ncbi:arrestin [Astrocystis sublimbata]|nr:arrestin [Astrocystis sublimbata]